MAVENENKLNEIIQALLMIEGVTRPKKTRKPLIMSCLSLTPLPKAARNSMSFSINFQENGKRQLKSIVDCEASIFREEFPINQIR